MKLVTILLGFFLQISGVLKMVSSLTVYGPCGVSDNEVSFLNAQEIIATFPIVCANWKWQKPKDVDITPNKENLDIAANFFVGVSLIVIGSKYIA